MNLIVSDQGGLVTAPSYWSILKMISVKSKVPTPTPTLTSNDKNSWKNNNDLLSKLMCSSYEEHIHDESCETQPSSARFPSFLSKKEIQLLKKTNACCFVCKTRWLKSLRVASLYKHPSYQCWCVSVFHIFLSKHDSTRKWSYSRNHSETSHSSSSLL